MKQNSGIKSTMRVCVFMASVACTLVLMAIAFCIIYNTVHNHLIDWSGISTVTIATGGVLTGILFTKAKQKETEVKAENKTQP